MTQAGQIGPQLVQPKGPINPVPQDKVGRMLHDHEYDTPKKGKLRVMTVSDSAWAPTGFGSNTKNIASILNGEGHHIGYGGCQNPHHAKWQCPWPLGQEETWATFENLPIMFPGQEKYGKESFPHWVKGFAQFVKKNNLTPKQVKLILHMDWNDAMGWKFPEFADQYGVGEYLMPPLMDNLDQGDAINEEQMAHLYNCMDMFVLPTGGEGFGIPTLEAMSCGIPVCATNYTTSYELIKCEDAENEEVPMYPLGGDHTDSGPNGRDHLEEEDICERGILIPYKDMWWDTPNRAAPQRAIASENAIAEAIQHYYDNPVKKLEAGKAGRKHAVKNYSWNVIGKKWIDWINNITEELK